MKQGKVETASHGQKRGDAELAELGSLGHSEGAKTKLAAVGDELRAHKIEGQARRPSGGVGGKGFSGATTSSGQRRPLWRRG